MKKSEYFKNLVGDFFKAYGCLMVVSSIFLWANSLEIINTSLLWQFVIIAAAYTFFKMAFVNSLDLGEKNQLTVYTISSTLGDLMVILWLGLFSPNVDNNLITLYIIMIVLVKGAVFAMMYIDGRRQAKELNEKLNQYKNGINE